jgi:hypothetical protein
MNEALSLRFRFVIYHSIYVLKVCSRFLTFIVIEILRYIKFNHLKLIILLIMNIQYVCMYVCMYIYIYKMNEKVSFLLSYWLSYLWQMLDWRRGYRATTPCAPRP